MYYDEDEKFEGRRKVCPYCGRGLDEEDRIDDDTYYCPTCDREIDVDED